MKNQLSLFWTFLLTRFRVTVLLTAAMLIVGIGSYQSIPRESDPDVEIPIAAITTVWPGATAQDVEKLVTEKIEAEIKTLDDLKQYNSSSRAGFSSITAEFESGSDMDKNMQRVREALDDAKPKLPDSLPADPDLEEASVSSTPILTLAFSGDYSYRQLEQFAESVQTEVEAIGGVKGAPITGISEEEFHLYLDPVKLQGFGISIDQIVSKLQQNSRDIPLGDVFISGEKIEVRLAGELKTVEDFMSQPLFSQNGQIIRLGEIGEVRREFDAQDIITKLSTDGRPLERFISLDVLKAETKTDILKVIDKTFSIVEEKRATQEIPDDLFIDIVFDRSQDIEDSLNTLLSSGVQTIILIGLILLIALGWREAVLAFLSIPLALLVSVALLNLIGETFNFLSLFSLVLALGLLVDNSIIMIEGVSEGIYGKKLKPHEAALEAIQTFRWPVITGTATTIFAFLPMLFTISGVSGDFISVIPNTVTIVLLISLFISLLILPVFAAKFFEFFPPKKLEASPFMERVKSWYGNRMTAIVYKRKYVYLTLLVSFCCMGFAFWLPATGKVSVEIFPPGDQNFFTMKLEYPKGTALRETETLNAIIDEVLLNRYSDGWLKNYTTYAGQISPYDPDLGRGGSNQPESHLFGVTINLLDKSQRTVSSLEITDQLREEISEKLPGYVDFSLGQQEAGPPSGDKPISIRLVGENLDHLEEVSVDLQQKLAEIELDGAKLKQIDDDLGDQVSQLSWRLDRDQMERYGLSANSLSQTLRGAIQGVNALSVAEGDEEIDLVIRYDFEGDKTWDDPDSLDILKQIPIKTPAGDYIRLDDVASFTISPERTILKHRDGKRTITVGADIDGEATAAQFLPQINEVIGSLDKRPGEIFELGGDNEESNRLVTEMATAMGIAVLLILMILVLQFDSFLQPVVIVMLLPLSLTGVFIGFWLSGTPVGFPTMIGIVALAGIIVNDAIVLMDRINQLQKQGLARLESFIEAGRSRLQPIILTSLTTILGLLPLSLSDPIWMGLGFAIIYGMTLATILTVVLVPCLLIVFSDSSYSVWWVLTAQWWKKLKARFRNEIQNQDFQD